MLIGRALCYGGFGLALAAIALLWLVGGALTVLWVLLALVGIGVFAFGRKLDSNERLRAARNKRAHTAAANEETAGPEGS
jgi:hypothetical protein